MIHDTPWTVAVALSLRNIARGMVVHNGFEGE